VSVPLAGTTLTLWPFTGSSFSSAPSDPVNVLFTSPADPRGLRAALLLLDGDRTAFGMPNVFPFNCTWSDAIGEVQTAYAEPTGWMGSAIQLQCGDYTPMRFHLRLFDAGGVTLGGTHMDLQIPGTEQHQVISWMVARQLVMVDFIRSGLLAAPPTFTGTISPVPSFRDIPAVIYNGLPVALRQPIGGPLADVNAPVPLPSDGRAVILSLATLPGAQQMVAHKQFVLEFDQTIPKPFCAAGAYDYVLVKGPIDFDQRVVMTPSGNFVSQFHAVGHLEVTPVNPLTRPPTPIGETYRALVNEHHTGIVTSNVTMASFLSMQILLPPAAPMHGRLVVTLQVGPNGATDYGVRADCAP
jgi:hypothetical protein